jgi:hypothetical protein
MPARTRHVALVVIDPMAERVPGGYTFAPAPNRRIEPPKFTEAAPYGAAGGG